MDSRKHLDPSIVKAAKWRFWLAFAIGISLALALFTSQYLVEGMHPLDVWENLGIYLFFGVLSGFVVGVVWALFGS